jgi:hypothetical protein
MLGSLIIRSILFTHIKPQDPKQVLSSSTASVPSIFSLR